MIYKSDYPTPYYAVIFTSERTESDNGYSTMAEELDLKMKGYKGFLGIDSVRDSFGKGITVCYWQDMEAISAWKMDEQHQIAQQKGKEVWYKGYSVRIAKVEKAY